MQLNYSHSWFKRSRQMWKIRLMWMFAALDVLAWIVGLFMQWRTQTFHLEVAMIVLGSFLGGLTLGTSVRCRICGERVVATLFQHRRRSQFVDELRMLNECPVCGDPGDGSNPKRW